LQGEPIFRSGVRLSFPNPEHLGTKVQGCVSVDRPAGTTRFEFDFGVGGLPRSGVSRLGHRRHRQRRRGDADRGGGGRRALLRREHAAGRGQTRAVRRLQRRRAPELPGRRRKDQVGRTVLSTPMSHRVCLRVCLSPRSLHPPGLSHLCFTTHSLSSFCFCNAQRLPA
jgi:hypothetical protein